MRKLLTLGTIFQNGQTDPCCETPPEPNHVDILGAWLPATVSSTAVNTDTVDTGLSIDLEVGYMYLFDLFGTYQASTPSNLQIRMDFTGTNSEYGFGVSSFPTNTGGAGAPRTNFVSSSGSFTLLLQASTGTIIGNGWVNPTTAGTLNLLFRKSAATTGMVAIFKGTNLRVLRLTI